MEDVALSWAFLGVFGRFGVHVLLTHAQAFMTASQVTQREWHQPGNYSEAALKRNENK